MAIKKTMIIDGHDALSVALTMKHLGVTRPTLMKMVKDRKIGHYKIGARYWFACWQVSRYQESCKVDAE